MPLIVVATGSCSRRASAASGCVGVGQVDPAAGEDHRPPGAGQQRRRGLDVDRVGARAPSRQPAGGGIGRQIRGRERVAAVRDVLADVEQHRPRPAAGGDRVRPPHELGDALDPLDPDRLLDGRPQDRQLIGLLGGVLAGDHRVALARQRDHRHAGAERLRQAGDEVGGAGTERAVADAGDLGDAGVGVGHEGAVALVLDEHVVELAADVVQRVVVRQQLKAADPERHPRAVGLQHPDQRLPPGQLDRLLGLAHAILLTASITAAGPSLTSSSSGGE